MKRILFGQHGSSHYTFILCSPLVAVTGLPTPCEEHAVVMARFARECRDNMTKVTRKLEVTLGPDTADLQLRTGLHSGPVTAGVLRGEKGR